MPLRQRSRFPVRSSRRKTGWSAGPGQLGLSSLTANGSVMWSTGAVIGLDGLTLVRTRGSVGLWLEVVGTIGDGFTRVGLGICIVSGDAFGIGVTAVPTPLTDIAWDGWLWHKIVSPMFGFSVTEGENTGPISQVRVDIDSKAMRKQKETDVQIGVIEALGEVGTATLSFVADTRVLDKIP